MTAMCQVLHDLYGCGLSPVWVSVMHPLARYLFPARAYGPEKHGSLDGGVLSTF